MIPTCGTGAKTTMTFVPGATRCVFFLLASSCWHLCFCWSSAPCSRLRNDKSIERAPDRKRDGDPCRLSLPSMEDQRSSLPFATQITKWASREPWFRPSSHLRQVLVDWALVKARIGYSPDLLLSGRCPTEAPGLRRRQRAGH